MLLVQVDAVAELVAFLQGGGEGRTSRLFSATWQYDLWLILLRIDIENTLLLVLVRSRATSRLSQVSTQAQASVCDIGGGTRHGICCKHLSLLSINRHIKQRIGAGWCTSGTTR